MRHVPSGGRKAHVQTICKGIGIESRLGNRTGLSRIDRIGIAGPGLTGLQRSEGRRRRNTVLAAGGNSQIIGLRLRKILAPPAGPGADSTVADRLVLRRTVRFALRKGLGRHIDVVVADRTRQMIPGDNPRQFEHAVPELGLQVGGPVGHRVVEDDILGIRQSRTEVGRRVAGVPLQHLLEAARTDQQPAQLFGGEAGTHLGVIGDGERRDARHLRAGHRGAGCEDVSAAHIGRIGASQPSVPVDSPPRAHTSTQLP